MSDARKYFPDDSISGSVSGNARVFDDSTENFFFAHRYNLLE